MKYSCGHKADRFLTRDEIRRQKWCARCDPALKAKRQKQDREARARNAQTQRDLDGIGMGKYGPLPSQRPVAWNPTPEQFFNTLRALSIGDALRPKKQGEQP